MNKVSPDFQTKLEAIKAEYATESLPKQVSELLAQCDKLSAVSPDMGLNDCALELYAAAHKLTGSSGTFGFTEISTKSREICNLTDGERINATPFNISDRDQAVALVDQVQQLFNIAAKDLNKNEPTQIEGEAALPHKDTVIVLCNPNSYTLNFANNFIAQEFSVVHINSPAEIYQAAADTKAEIVVADLHMDGTSIFGELDFLKLNSVMEQDVSLVFVSEHTDMVARLAAVRAGGDAFIVTPFEDSELMDTIGRLVDTGLKAPHRVLIVDKDMEFIRSASSALEDAGMICEVVTDPIKTMDALASFVPESILMDISMPECTGRELASVILQQETFVGTPIIFMSEDRRREGRIDVVKQSAYSYMAKPVDIERLVGEIRGQATRFRALRARMVTDSLTGLNNHSMTRRLLEREIDNARRTKLPLSYVVIDIDHFKEVNDTYGHATGDKVLRSMSRLLKQRFRSNDVVGRIGGEEFAVVIAGTTGTTSKVICDQVREAFSNLQFKAGDKTFSCKFSAGIAEYPDCEISSNIMEAADKALYEAKRTGRNQVVLAPHKIFRT